MGTLYLLFLLAYQNISLVQLNLTFFFSDLPGGTFREEAQIHPLEHVCRGGDWGTPGGEEGRQRRLPRVFQGILLEEQLVHRTEDIGTGKMTL